MSREELVHNPSNPVTAGIWRVVDERGSRVHKVLTGRRPAHHPDWPVGHDPRSWNAWRREAEVYAAGLHDLYAPEGIRGPRLLDLRERPDGDVELVLEHVDGPSGPALSASALVDVARRLGEAQGRLARTPVDHPWLSRGFLRAYVASKHVDRDLLHDDAAWAHPLVRSTWPEGLRAALVALDARREALLALAEALPRTVAHLDLWSHNLVGQDEGFVLLDWSAVGDGALGEDVSNLVVEAALDELLPDVDLVALGEDALAAYTAGVRASGWAGEPADVRRGFLAAAVKWCWLGPLHLERARTGEHHRYGGADDPAPVGQYRARGRALATLAGWAAEALA